MQKSIQVRILGKEYPLRVHEQDEDAMYEVARTVDSYMQFFKKDHPHQSDLVAAVIAALTLAEEVHTMRDTSNSVLQTMYRQMQHMEGELKSALKA